ncbi:MAG: hypothetical protein SGPRY_007010 [Prymnesium sp.]
MVVGGGWWVVRGGLLVEVGGWRVRNDGLWGGGWWAAGVVACEIGVSGEYCELIDNKRASELLYIDVLWKLLNDKWTHFAKWIFHWFIFLNVVSLVSLTLSLCSTIQGDSCNAVLLMIFIPIPLNGMPAIIGDLSCFANLAITSWLLLRRVVTQTRLCKPLWPDYVEIISCILPWVAMPFRFSIETIGVHYVILGFASAFGWLRFLQAASDSFKFSPQMGPLVLMVQKMVVQNVLPFMTMFVCFFLMTFTWLGINNMTPSYNSSEAPVYSFPVVEPGDDNIVSVNVWDLIVLLTRFTINPDTSYRVNPLAGSDELEQFALAVQWVWVVLSHIVLLNALIAMMNTTYANVNAEQEAEWRLQFLEQATSLRRHSPHSHPPDTPLGEWLPHIYRHGDDYTVNNKVQKEKEKEVEAGVPEGSAPGAMMLTDAQLELRLKEFEQRMEYHVNKAVTKALAGMTMKVERLLSPSKETLEAERNKTQINRESRDSPFSA